MILESQATTTKKKKTSSLILLSSLANRFKIIAIEKRNGEYGERDKTLLISEKKKIEKREEKDDDIKFHNLRIIHR